MSKLFGWLNKKKPEEKPQNDVPATEPADVPADITPDADAPVEPAVVELAAEPEVAENNDVPDVELVEEPTQAPAEVPEPEAAPAPAPEKPAEEKKSYWKWLCISVIVIIAAVVVAVVSAQSASRTDRGDFVVLSPTLSPTLAPTVTTADGKDQCFVSTRTLISYLQARRNLDTFVDLKLCNPQKGKWFVDEPRNSDGNNFFDNLFGTRNPWPPLAAQSNMRVKCGTDGSIDNRCVVTGITGGYVSLLYSTPTFSNEVASQNVVFEGLTFELTRERFVELSNAGDITFRNCLFRVRLHRPILEFMLRQLTNECMRQHRIPETRHQFWSILNRLRTIQICAKL